jgi:transcriptional regulator NrdR family protein
LYLIFGIATKAKLGLECVLAMDLQIIKRDGRVEDFDTEKIKKVVKAAGLSDVEADELSERISKWAHTLNREEVSSLEVRDKVIEELQELDEFAANLFAWYQKTKDGNHDSEEE